MPPQPKYRWVFDSRSVRYRDLVTGRYVSSKQVREWSNQALDKATDRIQSLANQIATDRLTVTDWERGMREELRKEYISQYLAGRGGLYRMTQADWGSVGGMLAEQYRYLSGFAREIAAGNLTEGQIAMRATMYVRSAQEAYWRALERAQGMPPLPAYPGDGSSECLTNCRCHWDITTHKVGGMPAWDCYWRLGEAEHCETCVDRSGTWNPLTLP